MWWIRVRRHRRSRPPCSGLAQRLDCCREILVGEPEPAANGGFDVVDHAFPRGLDAEVAPAAVMMGVVFVLVVLVRIVAVAVAVFLVTRPRVAEDVYPLAGDPLAVAFLAETSSSP